MIRSTRPLFCCLALLSITGGIQRFNQHVVQTLVARGRQNSSEPLVAILADPANTRCAGAEIEAFSGERVVFFRRAVALSRSADILILDHINLLPVAALAKLLRPSLPVLMFAHGIDVWGDAGSRLKRFGQAALLRVAVNRIACVSAYTRDRMATAFFVPRDRFRLLPNCVPKLASDGSKHHSNSPVVLTVSRLDRNETYKNIDKLIMAVAKAVPCLPQLRLHIVGEGSWRPELERLAREQGVADRVAFLGRVSDEELERAYEGATIFALPSTREGFGIAYLEAWRHGLPVIGAAAGAAPEVIEHGVDGLLVDPEDPNELTRVIENLVADPGLRGRLAAAGREKVNAKYLYEHFAENLSRILDELQSPARGSLRA